MHVESVVERRAENVLRVGRQMIPHGGLQVVIYGVRHDGVASRNGIEAIAAEKLLPHPSCIVACQRIVGQHPPHKPSSKEMSPHEERRFCWPRAKCGAGPDRAISVARGTRRRESLNKRTGLAAKELAAGRHKPTFPRRHCNPSNLSRISREPYGFGQLRSANALQPESFRRTARLRGRAVHFHHPGTRAQPRRSLCIQLQVA